MTSTPHDPPVPDGLEELVEAASGPLVEVPDATTVVRRHKQAEALAAKARGGNRPVQSGAPQHPRLRTQPWTQKR
jgi:hypothetical protein